MSASVRPRPSAVELHRLVGDRLGARGQRYTDNRRRIVEVLAALDRPVTLPALITHDASLAQSSAYRNLAVMEEAGVVRRLVHGAEHAHFELAEDLTEHHHHLICERCGVIRDITLDSAVEARLDEVFADVAAAAGFRARHHDIDLFGLCPECAA